MANDLQTPSQDDNDLAEAPDRNYTDKGIKEAEDFANRLPSRNQQLAKTAFSPSSRWKKIGKWKILGAAGGAIAILGTIAGIFFFLLLFKNVHIKHLFMDYRFAKFNRAINQRLKVALDEASAEGDAPAGGDASTTTDPSASPEDNLRKANADELDRIRSGDADTLRTAEDGMHKMAQSDVAGAEGRAVDEEFGLDRSIKDAKTESADDAAKAVEDKISSKGEDTSNLPDGLKDTADEAKRIQDENPKTSWRDAVGKALDTDVGQKFMEGARTVGSWFVAATFYCIAHDFVTTGKHAFASILTAGAANVAETTASAADCQQRGECSVEMVGAVANKSDNGTESFTQSCGAQFASNSGQAGSKCVPIPKEYLVTSKLPVPDEAKPFVNVLDVAADPGAVSAPLGFTVDKICGFVLDLRVQLFAGAGQLALLALGPQEAALAKAADAAFSALLAAVGTTAGKALMIDAIVRYGGGLFKDITPHLFGNLMDMGSKVLASDTARRDGGQKLTSAQAFEMNNQIRQEKIAEANRRGWFYRFLSPDNEDSLTVRVVMQTPTSASAVISRTNGLVASLFNPKLMAQLFSQNLLAAATTPTYAVNDDPNMYGVPEYGMPDVNKYGIVENSRWVKAYDAAVLACRAAGKKDCGDTLEEQFDKCFDDPFANVITDDSGKYGVCDGAGEPLSRYRQYRFDRQLTYNLVVRYNNQ